MWLWSDPTVTFENALYTFDGGNQGITLSGVYNYPTLVQAIIDFAHRADIAPYEDYFIQNAETRIYRDVFSKNIGNGVQWLEQTYSAQIGSNGQILLPAGYIAIKSLRVSDGNGAQFSLLYKDPQWIYTTYPIRQPSGIPAYIARSGSGFIFGPYPDSQYTVSGTIYAQTAALTSTNITTWMTTYLPDIFLAACMLELQPFLKDPASGALWQSIYDYKIQNLVDLDKSERYAPGALMMQVA